MACAKVGPSASDFAKACASLKHRFRLAEPAVEAPALGLAAVHRAAGIEELGRAPRPDDPRQHIARTHVGSARPTRTNRKATLLRAVPRRRSEAIARIAPAPAQIPSTAATIGCGQPRIALTTSPVMRVKASRRPHRLGAAISTSGPMISCLAAGAEIAAGAGDYHGLDVVA